MGFQVRQAVFARELCCSAHRARKRSFVYPARTEKLLERVLGVNQLCADRSSFCVMRARERLDGCALLGAQAEFVSELERVPWSGIVVELGAFRVAHPGARKILL